MTGGLNETCQDKMFFANWIYCVNCLKNLRWKFIMPLAHHPQHAQANPKI